MLTTQKPPTIHRGQWAMISFDKNQAMSVLAKDDVHEGGDVGDGDY